LFFKVLPNARKSALPARVDALKSNPTSERGKKKRLLFVSLVFLTFGGLVFWASAGFSRQRLHKGKRISYWTSRPPFQF